MSDRRPVWRFVFSGNIERRARVLRLKRFGPVRGGERMNEYGDRDLRWQEAALGPANRY